MPKPVYALIGDDSYLQLQQLASLAADFPADAQRIDIILESGLKTITRQVFGGADGIINMPWQAGDTDVPGTYNGLARVTFGDGKIQTWPAQGNFFVTIRE